MKKIVSLFRKVILAISLLIVIVLAGATAILLMVSPNQLKPHIEEKLAENGIAAQFNGDLHWSLYPVIGISVEQFKLLGTADTKATTETNKAIAELGNLVLGVKLMPLFKKQLEVETVFIEGARISYIIDKNGQSNWQPLLDSISTGSAEQPEPEPQEAPSASFQIAKVQLKDAQLSFVDETSDSASEVTDLNVLVTGFSSGSTRFPVSVSATLKHNDFPAINVQLNSSQQLDLETSQVVIEKAELTASSLQASASLIASGKAAWADAMKADFSLTLEPLSPENWAKVAGIALPERAGKNTLRRMAAKINLNMNDKNVSLPKLHIEFDDIRIDGDTTVILSDTGLPAVTTRWKTNAINLDNYLPPPAPEAATEPEAEATEAEVTEEAVPQPLPVDMLRELNIDAGIDIASLTVAEQTVEAIKLTAKAKNGVINTRIANANSYEATLTADALLDARKNTVTLDAKAATTGLNVGKLMKSMADMENLAGIADTTVTATAAGKTDKEFIDSIDANIELRSDQLSINPINIEKAYCQLVALADNKKLPEREWPQLTKLTPIKVDMRYHNNSVNVSKLSAEIDRLSTSATGKLDLESGRFDFPIDISMANFSVAKNACAIVDEKWQNRIIPLRCKGSLDGISYDTCTPDMKRLGELAKQRLNAEKQKIEAKAEKKIEQEREKAKDKVDEEAKKLLNKHLKKDDKGLGGSLNKFLNR